MMRDPDAGGWKRLPDGDSFLRHKELPKDNKFHKRLYIYKNQLMFDIESQCELITLSRNGKDETENNIEKFKGQFDRWINKYVEKVKERLMIAVYDERNYSNGNQMKEWDEKEILLAFPHWWDDTAWNPLIEAVHSYVVNSVLSEYLKLTLTSKDPVTLDKINDASDDWEKLRVLQCQHRQGEVRRELREIGF